jgi:hypothetical protein
MRKQLLSVFLPLLLLGLMASAAETPALPTASQQNELQRVNVVRGADEIRVEIDARGALTPKLSTADSPSRVIVDLPGTVMATGKSHITVGSAGVKGVRIGMDGQTPPTTRVVVDLEHACRYELTPSKDGKLVLTLHVQHSAATNASAPKTAAQTAPAPVNAVMSPFAPHVMEVTPKTQPVAASVSLASKPSTESAVAATAQKTETASTSSSSSDFVFVEPTYAAKANAADASDETAGRAQEAAAKFADKTAAELLPVSMHAAQSSQSSGSSTGIQPAVNLAAEQKAQSGQQPVSAGPKYTGEPISVNL